jgi:repressor LexA
MFVRDGESFALRVSGDSMKNGGIFDGDVVIVRPQAVAKGGDVVVALIDDEATVKTYTRSNGRVVLKAENPDYDDIVLDGRSGDTRLLGKVVGLMRKIQ